jgi:predicted HTH transcriptional regulator
MGEGVDPTQMCRSLVEKVARGQQLQAETDPGLLMLFEDWLEELEEEMASWVKESSRRDPRELAQKLGISEAGAAFLLRKLQQEGRLS